MHSWTLKNIFVESWVLPGRKLIGSTLNTPILSVWSHSLQSSQNPQKFHLHFRHIVRVLCNYANNNNNYVFIAGSSLGFVPALGFIIISHYSVNGELLKEHFNTAPEAQRSNVFLSDVKDVGDGVPTSVFESLIYTLSYDRRTVHHRCHNRK